MTSALIKLIETSGVLSNFASRTPSKLKDKISPGISDKAKFTELFYILAEKMMLSIHVPSFILLKFSVPVRGDVLHEPHISEKISETKKEQ